MDFGAVDYPKSIHPHEAPPPARRNALKTVKPESDACLARDAIGFRCVRKAPEENVVGNK